MKMNLTEQTRNYPGGSVSSNSALLYLNFNLLDDFDIVSSYHTLAHIT